MTHLDIFPTEKEKYSVMFFKIMLRRIISKNDSLIESSRSVILLLKTNRPHDHIINLPLNYRSASVNRRAAQRFAGNAESRVASAPAERTLDAASDANCTQINFCANRVECIYVCGLAYTCEAFQTRKTRGAISGRLRHSLIPQISACNLPRVQERKQVHLGVRLSPLDIMYSRTIYTRLSRAPWVCWNNNCQQVRGGQNNVCAS